MMTRDRKEETECKNTDIPKGAISQLDLIRNGIASAISRDNNKSNRDSERLSVLNSTNMDRMSFSSIDSDQRRTRRNRICMGLSVGLVCVVILIAGLVVGLRKPSSDSSSTDPPVCTPLIDDVQKFDCHPDRPISQQKCLNRGCCFIPGSDLDVGDYDLINSSYLGVPSCFFPHNYKGYEVTDGSTLEGSTVSAKLKRVKASGFPKDVQELKVEVTPIDDNRLRIKILDASSKRYEPEVPRLEYLVKGDRNEKYMVNFTGEGLLDVTRRDTQQTVFRTQLSRLIFSDQFLQLSTEIASNNIFGLGEQKEGIRKSTNFTRYTLFNQGDLPVPHRNLYGSHPFYLVMEPDGQANGVFLLNTNAIDYVLQDRPAVTIRTVGGILDFVLFLGPTPADVVSQYTALFGRPNFPPRWSLGFQICKYGYFTLEKTKAILQRNLDVGIPIDVQWHDIDYMLRHLDFTYDPVNFTGLPEFVKELHKDGRHYIAMISPGVSNTEIPGNYTAFDVGKELDLFIKDASGKYIEGKVWNDNFTVFPDFSNSATENYWKDRFAEFHEKLDFDGVWIDMNEPLNFLNGSSEGCPDTSYDNPPYLPGRPYPLNTLTLCMSAKHNRTVHYNEHNLEAYREAKATHQAMKEITKKRPFIISRASFSGQGIYSGHWSGDITSNWDDLRYTIPAMLAFSLYGMPMTGSDICGFRLNTTEELCARWHSLGAFYPLSRNHNDFDTIEQDPAAMGKTVIEAAKKALRIRYYLLPYLYTLFYRNHVKGETVARPLFFEFPMDKKTYTIEDEFLWGPALLIMPALEPGINAINPYIPEGVWYEFATGKPLTSKGERLNLVANITDINVAVRGGYILPAQEPGNTTMDSARSPFDFLVALDSEKKATGELYWDDGESPGTYDDGNYNLIQVNAGKNSFTTNVQKNGTGTPMELGFIRVYGVDSAPTSVNINNDPAKFTFEKNELRIDGTTYSLGNVVVTWQ